MLSLIYVSTSVKIMKDNELLDILKVSRENNETVLQGHHEIDQVLLSADGSVANRNLELARVLGLIESASEISPGFLMGTADWREVDRWIRNARSVSQIPQSGKPPMAAETSTRAGFLQYAAGAFFGIDEIGKAFLTGAEPDGCMKVIIEPNR